MKFSDWPWGERATMDEHGVVERLAPETPVEFWICCRLDQPWTWTLLPDQHVGQCVDCRAAVMYAVSAKTPTDPAVRKLCVLCAERRLEAEEG